MEVDDRVAGRYRVIRELGSGAMGAVYEAEHLTLEQRVAIKILQSALVSTTLVPRFFREAKAASSLGHPNIVRVFDAGTLEDKNPYLVMELLEGRSLEDVVQKDAPISVERVVELLRGPASGLDLAHARGIVHRDLKPENLFVHRREDGTEEVKVVDFGLATFTFDVLAPDRLTDPGTFLGTPEYMAPEMVEETPPDQRADVYSLAVVAYELLTNELPIYGQTPLAILGNKVAEPAPPLSHYGMTFPHAVEAVFERALHRTPQHRHTTCGALINELARAGMTGSRTSRISDISQLSRVSELPLAPDQDLGRKPSLQQRRDILLVDDDKDFGKLIERELNARGFRLIHEQTIQAGEERAMSRPFGAAIVDGLLPDGSGLELVSRLRAGGWSQPILFVSGFWRGDQSRHLLSDDLDVNVVLHKPLDPGNLAAQVLELVPIKKEVADNLTAVSNPELDAQLAVLKAQYLKNLMPQLQQLYDHIYRVASGAADSPEPLEKAGDLAHQIKGTAGSYGFSEVSARAAHVQDALEPLRTGAGYMPTLKHLQTLLDTVRGAQGLAESHVAQTAGVEAVPAFVARLLLASSASDDTALVDRASRIGIQIRGVASATDGVYEGALVREEDPDVARTLITELRGIAGLAEIPIALLASIEGTAQSLAAVRAGASAVLSYEPDAPELLEVALRFRTLKRNARPKLLAIDDDEDLVARVEAWLRPRGVTVIGLHRPEQTLETLERHEPDAVLLDLVMPRMSGVDVCRVIRSAPRWSDLPIVFLTSNTDVASRMSCYWAGADDVMAKPVVPEELHARVGLRLRAAALDRERREMEPLTGVLNRQAFARRAARMLGVAEKRKRSVGVALIDVDGLKQINDSHGHDGGDAVLRALGGLLTTRLRADDLIGRWGGDELAVAMPSLTSDEVTQLLQELLETFQRTEVFAEDGAAIHCSFRAGVACAPEDGVDLLRLVTRADQRLYAAKRSQSQVLGG